MEIKQLQESSVYTNPKYFTANQTKIEAETRRRVLDIISFVRSG